MNRISFGRKAIVAVLIAFLGVSAVAFGQSAGDDASLSESKDVPEIRLNDREGNENFGTVGVVGIDAVTLTAVKGAGLTVSQWQQIFSVYTGDEAPSGTDKKPAILGTYHIEAGTIRFRPRFPLVKGLSYCAQFHRDVLHSLANLPAVSSSKHSLQATFILPKPPEIRTTVVSHVYPTAKVLPENLLKFYIHFSAPMSRGDVYENIHIIDASGEKIQAPFLELDQELWDANTQRLTLFFDPGRIKRGLRPHEDLGLPLREGQTYRLVVEDHLRDAGGNPLAATFHKEFTVTASDRTSPHYESWHVAPPPAQTFLPVTVRFAEPLDHALLGRMLWVEASSGNRIGGTVKISNDETEWQFTPGIAWGAGGYHIQVDANLEDLAGNKLNRLFDVDTQTPGNDSDDERTVTLRFRIE